MSKEWVIAIFGGCVSAAASLAFIGGVPGAMLFVYMAPLPMMLAGLALGPTAAVLAAVAGALTAGMIGTLVAAALFVLIHGFPAWMTVRLALMNRTTEEGDVIWYPAGSVLSWIAALGGALFLGTVLLVMGGTSGFQTAVAEYLNLAMTLLVPDLPEEGRKQAIAMMTPLFPSVVGVTWVLMTAANAAAAQGLARRLGRALRPSPVYSALELPVWLSWMLVASAALALTGPLMGMGEIEYMGRNLAVISAVPFFLLGVAVVRTLVKRPMFVLILIGSVYLLLLAPGMIALVITGIGLTEQWIGLRRRFAGTA